MNRPIKKVAVIGSGIMGAGIACHFANIGVEVLLLDIVPFELTEAEKKKGLTLQDNIVKNRLVNNNLKAALKSKPSPIYKLDFAERISTGNLDDDIEKIKDVDWIIEVVVERLDIKQQVFEKIEKHRKKGTLITSNTSGIPIQFMNEGRSEDFQQHFAARMDWCVEDFDRANHAPKVSVQGFSKQGSIMLQAKDGEILEFNASGSTDPDGDELHYEWMVYPEAGNLNSTPNLKVKGAKASVKMPKLAADESLHIILRVTDKGSPALTSYERIIIKNP